MGLTTRCGAVENLQTRRAERCECNNDESAYCYSDGLVRLDGVGHICSIPFNLFGRK